MLAFAAVFIPLARAGAELSSRYPEQGGPYVWARRAFGPVHGFVCGWCIWVNNLFYFPSVLLFAAANALPLAGDRYTSLAESRTYSTLFVTATLWCLIAVNIVGLRASKWLQNAGSIGTWGPAGLLIASGVVAFAWFGSATSFAPSELLPRDDPFTTLGLWSAMCFAFSGIEVTSMLGREVKDPARTIPLGVIVSGVLVVVVYMGGSAAVLAAVPPSALAERSGIADAVAIVGGRVGLAGLGGLTGALVVIGALAGTNAWIAAAARVPFAVGLDGTLPAVLARLHPRYRTPHVALLVQGAAATAIFLASVFLTVTGASTTVQEAYDILVNVTILIYFVPYLYVFVALVRLRGDRTASPSAVRVPGGTPGLWLTAATGCAATTIALALVFVPPAGTANVANYEAAILLQAAVILAIGWVLYRRPR
jgi:amino acid transporter